MEATTPIPAATATTPPANVAPVVPAGMPATDQTKPKWALTQDQIDFLVESVTGIWPTFAKYWPMILGILTGVGLLGGATGRYTAPAGSEKPPTVIVVPHTDPIVPPVTSPIVPPVASKRKVMFYFVAADSAVTSAEKKALDGAGVTYDTAKVYPPGTGYRFVEKVVPMPCVVLLDDGGKTLDVQPYPVADLAAFVKGK